MYGCYATIIEASISVLTEVDRLLKNAPNQAPETRIPVSNKYELQQYQGEWLCVVQSEAPEQRFKVRKSIMKQLKEIGKNKQKHENMLGENHKIMQALQK